MSTFSQKIKELREATGISQRELARALRLSNGTISAWEKTDTLPSHKTLVTIADFFHVEISDLFDISAKTGLTRLQGIRESRGMGRTEASNRLNLSIEEYKNIERSRSAECNIELLQAIADLFNVEPEDLIDETLFANNPNDPSRPVIIIEPTNTQLFVDSDPSYTSIPLYGKIAAGTPIEMMEVDEHHPVPKPIADKYPKGFLLEVQGESMNKKLPNRSYAFINPTEEATDGKIHAVCVNGFDATIKRIRKFENGFELLPESTDPTFRPQLFDYNEPGTDTITIIGQVVYYVLPFDFEL